jgi:chromosomal replication initiator protein
VAEAPGQSYNPLYIYGGTGLGKTHLLHAIGHYVQDTRPGVSVAYVTAEHFLTRFIQAIQDRQGRQRFKDYYRGVDVLLIDDVQFLGGKGASTQEELFYTFNDLHAAGKQIVLTSDSEPSAIPQLEERLRSRFAWGLITDISLPDHATRVAILRKRAQTDGVVIDEDVFDEIAHRVTTNVRQLEGALTRVIGFASLTGRPVDRDLACTVLDSYVTVSAAGPVTIDRIQDVVCEHFRVTREDMLSPRRSQEITRPRQIAMYLARVMLDVSSKQIGDRFRRDHTTVLHAEKKVDEMIRSDHEVHGLVERLSATIRQGVADVQRTR